MARRREDGAAEAAVTESAAAPEAIWLGDNSLLVRAEAASDLLAGDDAPDVAAVNDGGK